MSFTRFQFATRAEAMDAAQALTELGIRLQTVDHGTTLLVRSEDDNQAKEAMARLGAADDETSGDARVVTPIQQPFDATVDVPGSKSHTNRALLCAALAQGSSTLRRLLVADDTRAMLGALERLQVGLDLQRQGQVTATATIVGTGPTGFQTPEDSVVSTGDVALDIDVCQSGTTGRFLLPALAGGRGRFRLDGHPQLRARPFGPQLDALRKIGAEIEGSTLPLLISGHQLSGGNVSVSGAISSQFLSGLIMAAPLFARPTQVRVDGPLVSKPYVELTIHTMATFGIEVESDLTAGRFDVPVGTYQSADLDLEPDASAASYFFAAAAITGSRVRVEGLGRSTVQGDLAFVRLLEQMGAEVTVGNTYTEVRGTPRLEGITVNMADISDTAQTLAVVAACATSPTEVTGVGFIRNKETDRIAATVTELNRLGVRSHATDDGFVVHPGRVMPGTVQTYDDHRMAMSFALLGLRHPGIGIASPGCVAKTFPNFFEVLESLR